MSKTTKARKKRRLRRLVRETGTLDGWGGATRHIYEFTEPTNVLSSHSCLLPEFSIGLRVGELRKLLAELEDDDTLTVTVEHQKPAKFTFIRGNW